MSLTLNMVGGGGGGGLSPNNAVIHVVASTGSEISFSKGGVVVEVLDGSKGHIHSDDNLYADYYYSISPSNYGLWTVSALLNGISADKTITVDSNKQYDVYLRATELYYYGEENVTGGFVTKNYDSRYTATGGSVTKHDNDMYILNVSYGSTCAATANRVDVTNFSKLEITGFKSNNSGDSVSFGLSNGLPDQNGVHIAGAVFGSNVWSSNRYNPSVKLLDISNITGAYYVFCGGLITQGFYLLRIRLVE